MKGTNDFLLSRSAHGSAACSSGTIGASRTRDTRTLPCGRLVCSYTTEGRGTTFTERSDWTSSAYTLACGGSVATGSGKNRISLISWKISRTEKHLNAHLPSLQTTALVAPAGQYDPAGHVTHAEFPPVANVPAEQVVVTPDLQKLPAGHE
jgi:hypothetical protein